MSNAMWFKNLAAAALATVILGLPAQAFSQIEGRVQDVNGNALSGACVEVWDNYPGGDTLATALTNVAGEFAIPAVVAGQIDLRVWRHINGPQPGSFKQTHFPTVVRNLPNPVLNTAVRLTPTPEIIGYGGSMCDFSDDATTFLGELIRPGDFLEVLDADGIAWGTGLATDTGCYLAHAYGDDPATPEIEGPDVDSAVGFRLNGLPTTVVNAPVIFEIQGDQIATLTGAATVTGVTMVGPISDTGHPGQQVGILFVVTNSGSLAGNFAAEVELDQPWIVQIQSAAGAGVILQPGESTDVLAQISIPGGTPDQDVEVRARVWSDSYGEANSGAWTILSVTTQTDIDDGGNGLNPSSFALAQNYPNPFNAGTHIAFSLTQEGDVRLTVCNLLGQDVRTLVDGHHAPGVYNAPWDGRDDDGMPVSSGVYFSRLSQNGNSQVRKMVLLK